MSVIKWQLNYSPQPDNFNFECVWCICPPTPVAFIGNKKMYHMMLNHLICCFTNTPLRTEQFLVFLHFQNMGFKSPKVQNGYFCQRKITQNRSFILSIFLQFAAVSNSRNPELARPQVSDSNERNPSLSVNG